MEAVGRSEEFGQPLRRLSCFFSVILWRLLERKQDGVIKVDDLIEDTMVKS